MHEGRWRKVRPSHRLLLLLKAVREARQMRPCPRSPCPRGSASPRPRCSQSRGTPWRPASTFSASHRWSSSTGGTIEITLGSGTEPCIALWYYEPRPPVVTRGTSYQEPPAIGGATLGSMGKRQERFPAAAGEGPVPRRRIVPRKGIEVRPALALFQGGDSARGRSQSGGGADGKLLRMLPHGRYPEGGRGGWTGQLHGGDSVESGHGPGAPGLLQRDRENA